MLRRRCGEAARLASTASLCIYAEPARSYPAAALAIAAPAVFFAGAFRPAVFFPAAGLFAVAAFCALTLAQRAFVAAMIACLPAAESFRLGFVVALEAGAAPACFFAAAHLCRCASAILARAAALIFRLPRPPLAAGGVALAWRFPPSIWRISVIWASIFCFCASRPKIAAFKISLVSFGFGI